jgi:hypothetical protein
MCAKMNVYFIENKKINKILIDKYTVNVLTINNKIINN